MAVNASRAAHTILRLYPRAWRDRYEPEVRALVEDSGATWRRTLDLGGGCVAAWSRAVAAERNRPRDPMAEARAFASTGARGLAAFLLVFGPLVLATVAVLAAAGVPWPPWQWWLWMLTGSQTWRPSCAHDEGIAYQCYHFLEATALAGLAWLLAWMLVVAGVPDPFEGRLWAALLAFVLGGLARLMYCGLRSVSAPGRWMGMHDAEIRAWRCGAMATMIAVAMTESSGQLFWMFVYFSSWMLTSPSGALTRLGAARRRAAFELSEQRLREKFPAQSPPAPPAPLGRYTVTR